MTSFYLHEIRSALLTLAAAIMLMACGTEQPVQQLEENHSESFQLEVSPKEISQFGHVWIDVKQISFPLDETSPLEVTIGYRPCLKPEITGERSLRCLAQGGPAPGAAWLTVRQAEQSDSRYAALTLKAAADYLFAELYAIGGSVGAGLQNASLTESSQQTGMLAQIARQAGAYFPLPLIDEAGFPPTVSLQELDSLTGLLDQRAGDAFLSDLFMQQEQLGAFRLDPEGLPHNLAIPYSGAASALVDGISGSDPLRLFEGIIRDPGHDGAFDPLIDELIRLDPSFLLASYELIDIPPQFSGSNHQDYQNDIIQELDRFFVYMHLFNHKPYLFMPNHPPAGIFPGKEYSEWARYESIWINNALHSAVVRANARFSAGPRIFVADLFSFLMEMTEAQAPFDLFTRQVEVEKGPNGENDFLLEDDKGRVSRIGLDFMEGLFSLDRSTFTATGNAILANLLIEKINEEIGPEGLAPTLVQDLALIDIIEVLSSDPLSISALAAELEDLPLIEAEQLADPEGLPGLHLAHRCAIEWLDMDEAARERCPGNLPIENAPSMDLDPATPVEFRLRLFTAAGESLGNYPVAAHARNGRIEVDQRWTDAQGGVSFTYLPAEDSLTDSIWFVSGNAENKLQVTLNTEAR